jgi:photosystem II stability/assembly factor-like uncharacterized protein
VKPRELERLGKLSVPPEGRERAVDAGRTAVERGHQPRRTSRPLILAIASVLLVAVIGVSLTPPGEAAASWVGRLVGVDTGKSPKPGTSLKGMVPLSVTFVSDQEGWMLGGLGCDARSCNEVVLKTTDYGHDWDEISRLSIPAPEGQPSGEAAVWGLGTEMTVNTIRFADGDNGWMFGSGLYATHDGGRSWKPIDLPGFVTDVEAWNGRAYAMVADCGTAGGWCSGGRLYRATTDGDQFRPVPGLPRFTDPKGRSFSASIVLHGDAAYVVSRTESSATLAASSDGRTWVLRDLPCRSLWPGSSDLAAWSETGLVFTCPGQPSGGFQLKPVFESTDGGASWTKLGRAPWSGYAGAIAAASPTSWYLATMRGPIYITSNAGESWRAGPHGPAWEGFSWVGFTDATHGVALPSNQHASAAWFTETGGDGWYTHSW